MKETKTIILNRLVMLQIDSNFLAAKLMMTICMSSWCIVYSEDVVVYEGCSKHVPYFSVKESNEYSTRMC